MSTPGAIQHIVEHIKGMQADFFDHSATDERSQTRYNNVTLTITNKGFSSATAQDTLHFLVELGVYQPSNSTEYTIWVNDPKEGDPGANQAAVISALESLVEKGTWNTKPMVTVWA